jgi:hypothetical protein
MKDFKKIAIVIIKLYIALLALQYIGQPFFDFVIPVMQTTNAVITDKANQRDAQAGQVNDCPAWEIEFRTDGMYNVPGPCPIPGSQPFKVGEKPKH